MFDAACPDHDDPYIADLHDLREVWGGRNYHLIHTREQEPVRSYGHLPRQSNPA